MYITYTKKQGDDKPLPNPISFMEIKYAQNKKKQKLLYFITGNSINAYLRYIVMQCYKS